jgi:hypothetical protein
MFEGTFADALFASAAPAARGVTMGETKALVTAWLRERVRPGDSCFVHGTSSILYDLLECGTRRASTSRSRTSFPNATVSKPSALCPPIRRRGSWRRRRTGRTRISRRRSPATSRSIRAAPNGAAAKVLHVGIQGRLGRYEIVGETAFALRPDLLAQPESHREKARRFRLYRLRRS